MKSEIKQALSAVYRQLSHSFSERATVTIAGGHIIEGGKRYQRTGHVAWKACYRAIRFDGAVSTWEEGMDDASRSIGAFLGEGR